MKKLFLIINLLVFILFFSPSKSFIFSVIIAIYNTGRYLDDSIGSLLNQTINIKKIQIILVNDGSTDNTENICLNYKKKYYNNIIYIKIEHRGVSNARNIGIEYSTGKYINFLDADDKWESKAFRYYLIFFHFYKNVDVAAGRLQFFEALNTPHPLDYKFYKTRVVNLTEEYNCIQLSCSSAIFRNSLVKGRKFEENIFTGEDTRFINNILLLKPIIGLIREAIYYYRKRSDYSSAVQTQNQKVDFYFSQINYVDQYLLEKSKELYNIIVPFIQFYIGYDDLWRILSLAFKHLNSDDLIQYIKIIEAQINQIEDKYILEQKFTSYKIKLFTLSKKYNRDLRYDVLLKNDSLIYSKYILIDLNNNNYVIIWRLLEIKNNYIHLVGKDNLWMPKEKYFYSCVYGNKTFFPKYLDYSNYDFYTMYGFTDKGRIVIFDIPIALSNLSNKQIFKFFIIYDDNQIEIFPSLGRFTHISSVKNGYYSNGNYIIKIIDRRLVIYKYNKELELDSEKQYCIYLKNKAKENIIELRKNRITYRDSKLGKKYKQIWIINDKKDIAGDNGEFFFRYLMNKHLKDIKIYFVISKDCHDFERLQPLGNIIDFQSKKYLKEFLNADKIITSIFDSWPTNPFNDEEKYVRDLFHFDIIFLQSGIIKDDLSSYLNILNKNFSLVVSSSKKEYKSFLSSKYGYQKNNVILTGLSRYDNLIGLMKTFNKEKLILIIPTFRTYIRGTRDLVTEKPIYSKYFKNTSFYNFYNNVINDGNLTSYMRLYNYTGLICLHPYYSEQIIDFKENKYFSIYNKCNYQELITKASILLTDYSTILFDFAYLKKPIVFIQFDIEDYRRLSYPEGFFDYKKEVFGPICNNINCTVSKIINLIKNNCVIEKKYLRGIKKFFFFFDDNNNYRIYNELIQNSEGKKKDLSINDTFLILFLVIVGLLKSIQFSIIKKKYLYLKI